MINKKIFKEKKKETEYSAPAIDRMLDIIEFMAEDSRPFGLTELSNELNISTNSIFRIMKRLTERGYTEIDSESGGHLLSTRFFSLGMKLYSRFDLKIRARSHLESLCKKTNETCQIQVLHGKKMLVIDTVNPVVDFFLQIIPGSQVYIHPNAFGKVVLAFMDSKEVSKSLPAKLISLTPNTITDKIKLKNELKTIRQNRIAYDKEEYNIGIFCLAAPVFNVENKVIAGVGITGLSTRFNPDKCKSIEIDVLNCAKNISKDIGYLGDIDNDFSNK